MVDNADFSGWASKANLKCSDGRTIVPGAFQHQDSTKVPLVWQHAHNEPSNVLGHALLENRPEGVYCHGFFNDTESGQSAKKLVQHGDIESLSIYANKLKESSKVVTHGQIREVSLVIAGANPGAFIDQVNIRHADDSVTELDDEAIIYTGLQLELKHSDTEEIVPEETVTETVTETADIEHAESAAKKTEKTVKDIFETLNEEQKNVVYYMIGQALENGTKTVKHSDEDLEGIQAVFESFNEEQADIVHTMLGNALAHAKANSDDSDKTVEDVFNTLSDEQKDVVYYMIGQALQGNKGPIAHADQADIKATYDSFNEEQQNVVAYMIGQALEHAGLDDTSSTTDAATDDAADTTAAHADNQEGTIDMTHNVFESSAPAQDSKATLSHADLKAINERAIKNKSTFKTELEDFVQHSDHLAHGIDDLDVLFPDARATSNAPEILSRRVEWVSEVMTGTKQTPFSRVKNLFANLTYESARAKGYIKGSFKKEEFFKVTKRVTGPTTVYKKQKLDRDDIVDITDFDVVTWLKAEMRLMLEEEIARAVLLGDGRDVSSEDKINEECIRPIATDSDFFVTYLTLDITGANGSATSPEGLIDALVLNRRHYRGSGNPTLFTSETVLAKLLLIKDTQGRRIYPTVSDLNAALRVSKIVTVELLDEPTSNVIGILVNLSDYTIGTDRGGNVSMFDDFDIDYNQLKYLIETRMSGALTKPKSAIVIRRVEVGTTLRTPQAPTWNPTTKAVTIPTVTGITYRNKLNNAVLTGVVTLAEEQELHVLATPATGTDYLASTAGDEWFYTYEGGLNASVIS